MLYIALTEAVLIALLIGTVLFREHDHDLSRLEADKAYRLERSELLTRIQHPQVYVAPAADRPAPPAPNSDLDEYERVGTITFGEPEDDA
jgi:hypothetical protein